VIAALQGREKDIAIFSAVRSGRSERSGIGFVADERRINVGLTRARSCLVLVGSAAALGRDPHWGALVSQLRKQVCLRGCSRQALPGRAAPATSSTAAPCGCNQSASTRACLLLCTGRPPMQFLACLCIW
jgi:hypothetical protein